MTAPPRDGFYMLPSNGDIPSFLVHVVAGAVYPVFEDDPSGGEVDLVVWDQGNFATWSFEFPIPEGDRRTMDTVYANVFGDTDGRRWVWEGEVNRSVDPSAVTFMNPVDGVYALRALTSTNVVRIDDGIILPLFHGDTSAGSASWLTFTGGSWSSGRDVYPLDSSKGDPLRAALVAVFGEWQGIQFDRFGEGVDDPQGLVVTVVPSYVP